MKNVTNYRNKDHALYQPRSRKDCNDINCTSCIFDSYRARGDDCPFRRWITDHPVEEPTEPAISVSARKRIIDECNRRYLAVKEFNSTKRYQKYAIDQEFVKADMIRDEKVEIPVSAVLKTHDVLDPDGRGVKKDLIHVITWLRPVE